MSVTTSAADATTNSLAIAAVTAVLKDLLQNSLAHGVGSLVGDATVSALPPDRLPTGADERARLNLYLYRVTPNTRWRAARPGSNGAGSAPLALDLHYLLTAYGERDLEAEILLGQAALTLHATPRLTLAELEAGLQAVAHERGGAAAQTRAAFGAPGLAARLGELTLTPEFMATEESSRLWSALQARCRPSLAFKVETVTLGGSA
jgi:hypothetical protein